MIFHNTSVIKHTSNFPITFEVKHWHVCDTENGTGVRKLLMEGAVSEYIQFA